MLPNGYCGHNDSTICFICCCFHLFFQSFYYWICPQKFPEISNKLDSRMACLCQTERTLMSAFVYRHWVKGQLFSQAVTNESWRIKHNLSNNSEETLCQKNPDTAAVQTFYLSHSCCFALINNHRPAGLINGSILCAVFTDSITRQLGVKMEMFHHHTIDLAICRFCQVF